jgi:hypothetical protein
MSYILLLVIVLLTSLILLYLITYRVLSGRIEQSEARVIAVFLQKIAKIPAVIEVMRPHVVDEHLAFDLMTRLHSEWLIHEYTSIPMLLEHNARINDQYGFLMRLSMAIPVLQKDAYFIYIRDFVMSYDRMMRDELKIYNALVTDWNRFVHIKAYTVIGYILPGREKMEV